MAVQSPTDRLVTEARAALLAADPTSLLGAAIKALLDPKLDDSQLNAANGVAGLGADGKVPAAQLPPASSSARGLVAAVTAPTVSIGASQEATALRMQATLDTTRSYEVQVLGASASGAQLFARALAGTTSPGSAAGTVVAFGGVSTAVNPIVGRFTVGTSGPYSFAFWAGSSSGFSNNPSFPGMTVSVTDVGPKLAGALPALP